jgi:hypothetical protein
MTKIVRLVKPMDVDISGTKIEILWQIKDPKGVSAYHIHQQFVCHMISYLGWHSTFVVFGIGQMSGIYLFKIVQTVDSPTGLQCVFQRREEHAS